MNKLIRQHVGIPVEEVGKKLKELHSAIEANGMAVAAEQDVSISLCPDGKAMSIQLKVYLFDEKGEDDA